MSIDYVSMMTDDELLYVCKTISGRCLKKLYKQNPKLYNRIKLGRRLNDLSDDAACEMAVRNKSEILIADSINKWIEEILNKIEAHRKQLEDSGESPILALVNTMPDSAFSDNLSLYFKLSGKEQSSEFVNLLAYAIELKKEARHTIPNTESSQNNAESSVRIQELEDEVRQLRSQIDIQAHDSAERIASLEQSVSAAQEEAKAISAQKDTLEKELRKYHELAKHKVATEDYLPLDDYVYMSLCEAISDENGSSRLRRCADYIDGTFTTVFYDEPQRWRLFRKNGIVSDGHWGVWDWKTIPRENGGTYIESALDTRIEPIGIVTVQNCYSSAEIVESLKNGIEITSCFNAVLLGYYSGSIFEGVYCNKSELSCVGTKYTVPSSINLLPVFEIMKDDIITIQDGMQIVRFLNLGLPARTVSVRTSMEIVKEHVVSRVTWAVMKQKGFSRSDFRETKVFLEQLQTDDIKEAIAASCNCSVDDTETLLDEFIAKASSVIDGTTLENDIMVQVIRNNAELYAQYMDSLRAEWEEQNQKCITEANVTLDAARKTRIVEETKAKELKNEQKKLTQEIEKQKAEISAQEQLAEDVRTKVLGKIESARKDAASFIAENAFLQPIQQRQVQTEVASPTIKHFFPGMPVSSADTEESNNWQELIETASYGLEEAGVSHAVSLGLSALMYSAYLRRIPLLLAGPNSSEIADAFSLAILGKLPGRLLCEGAFDRETLQKLVESEDEVIVIEQPFESEWYSHVVKLLAERKKFFIALNPFAEDLLMEPVGLWNYCVPVMTETIVTSTASGQYISGSASDAFKHFAVSEDVRRFKEANFLNLRPMTSTNVQSLGADLTEMCDGENIGSEYPLLIYPLAFLNGEIDTLRERIQDGSNAVPSEIRDLMKPFLGDEE